MAFCYRFRLFVKYIKYIKYVTLYLYKVCWVA